LGTAGLRALAGEGPDDRPPPEPADGAEGFRWGRSWFAPVPGVDGHWMELDQGDAAAAPWAGHLVSHLLGSERDSLQLVQQLHERLEEIELLYTISETLGRTLGLAESARTIVREVAQVVGARRASILVHDPDLDALRPVAGWGIEVQRFEPVPDSLSGPRREAAELGSLRLTAKELRLGESELPSLQSRIVISRFAAGESKRGVGIVRGPWQYELFGTSVPQERWPAAETVTAYYGRCAQENRFFQEDTQLGLDRIFSYHLPGQHLASAMGLFCWNVRLALGAKCFGL